MCVCQPTESSYWIAEAGSKCPAWVLGAKLGLCAGVACGLNPLSHLSSPQFAILIAPRHGSPDGPTHTRHAAALLCSAHRLPSTSSCILPVRSSLHFPLSLCGVALFVFMAVEGTRCVWSRLMRDGLACLWLLGTSVSVPLSCEEPERP